MDCQSFAGWYFPPERAHPAQPLIESWDLGIPPRPLTINQYVIDCGVELGGGAIPIMTMESVVDRYLHYVRHQTWTHSE